MTERICSLAEILKPIAARQEDIENWIKRFAGQFATKFEPTVRGRSRRFTRPNVYELGFLVALTASGIPISVAIAHAAAHVRAKKGGGWRDWQIFPAGDPTRGYRTNDVSQANLESLSERLGNPPALTVINLAQIVARVDALFDEGSSA
jgi:hypothetical protein